MQATARVSSRSLLARGGDRDFADRTNLPHNPGWRCPLIVTEIFGRFKRDLLINCNGRGAGTAPPTAGPVTSCPIQPRTRSDHADPFSLRVLQSAHGHCP